MRSTFRNATPTIMSTSLLYLLLIPLLTGVLALLYQSIAIIPEEEEDSIHSTSIQFRNPSEEGIELEALPTRPPSAHIQETPNRRLERSDARQQHDIFV